MDAGARSQSEFGGRGGRCFRVKSLGFGAKRLALVVKELQLKSLQNGYIGFWVKALSYHNIGIPSRNTGI